jgi:hypothetical protein
MRTEPKDSLGVGNRQPGVLPRVVLAGRAGGEAIRVSGGQVVLVQRLAPLNQVWRWSTANGQGGEEVRHVVPPGRAAEEEVKSLARFLGRLLGSKRRPLEVTLPHGQPGVVKIGTGLGHPIGVALGHGA